jgi:hypothetical protein
MFRSRPVAVVVALLALAAAPGALRAETKTLRLVERAPADTVTDTGEKGDSVGDLLTFANEVYDEKNATKVA